MSELAHFRVSRVLLTATKPIIIAYYYSPLLFVSRHHIIITVSSSHSLISQLSRWCHGQILYYSPFSLHHHSSFEHNVTPSPISEVKDSARPEQEQLKELVATIELMNVQFLLLVSFFKLIFIASRISHISNSLGTLCYCDEFCDRHINPDCCPDYESHCKGIQDPPNPIERCFAHGVYIDDFAEEKINCNLWWETSFHRFIQ